MANARFKAELRPSGRGGGGHLVEIPDEVVGALGGKGRISVQATFNGVPYRGSIVKMGGVMVLGVTKAIMAEAGIVAGDSLDVVVENEDAPREVETPPELAKALRKNSISAAAWDKLSYSHRKEYVGYIVEAKKEETRARRVDQTTRALEQRASSEPLRPPGGS
ncbi:MAG: YdeI/OmpD-associated family protein [Actinomycetota bacterium]